MHLMKDMGLGKTKPSLGYDPASLPRETKRHYIPCTEDEIQHMLSQAGTDVLEGLFAHIPKETRLEDGPDLPVELGYGDLQEDLFRISEKNNLATSFLGDGLPDYRTDPIVPYVCSLRNLATSYTPYQPERSQGTLLTHWIYQCLLAQLTGFEAINSSLYDRATAIHEAICCATRLSRKATTTLVPESLFPSDIEVLRTLFDHTEIKIRTIPTDPGTGKTCLESLESFAKETGDDLAAIVFPQTNNLGILEDVDTLTDLAHKHNAMAIAVIDPVLLATGGLKPPSHFGAKGADIIAGEAQHLAIAPNFGGPGLGLFGIRHNDNCKNNIRQTPGRYVGKSKDNAGRDCRVMVLSTREQHIRKEKATSNICSNQAFLATLAGASLLAKGETGSAASVRTARESTSSTIAALLKLPGIHLAFPSQPFFNEVTLQLPCPATELVEAARNKGLHIGIPVGGRIGGNPDNLLKISFSDKTDEAACEKLIAFFQDKFKGANPMPDQVPEIQQHFLRQEPAGLPDFPRQEVEGYYQQLSDLNISPEDTCYPLGSCTMKYNPYINEWAAGLPGFTDIHPQAPVADIQGSLEILFQIQEWFKAITGLASVTTQPVAGAQGELVGLKMFQAYHKDRGEPHRNILLIPKSAHGTNFATAATAGYGKTIVELDAGQDGQIDMANLENRLAEHGKNLCGILVTNPNTGGIYETRFHEIAAKVHAAGGLVYMDGANMNAIAGWCDLGKMGVDAIHNNLHKTWTIPHGGGGPGDAIVAVSQKLVDYLPGQQITQSPDGTFRPEKPSKSIGSFHRHWGNFAHKVRCFAYLLRLGKEGVPRMSAMAVLSARYLHGKLKEKHPMLPECAAEEPRMHEFILTLSQKDFDKIESAGVQRSQIIPQIGKLFLDFGFHAPTVAFPETFGLMIEPTESYTKKELDRFAEAVEAITALALEHPDILKKAPHFTPIDRIDEVAANRNPILSERLAALPPINPNRLPPDVLQSMSVDEISKRLVQTLQH
jgi:glycine dehydrogenase